MALFTLPDMMDNSFLSRYREGGVTLPMASGFIGFSFRAAVIRARNMILILSSTLSFQDEANAQNSFSATAGTHACVVVFIFPILCNK
jgi:hypothetical protein